MWIDLKRLGAAWALSFCFVAHATLLENQVVVVYNAASTDAATLKDAYLAAHPGVPQENVCSLNDTQLVGIPDISYADFITLIRDPIRDWFELTTTPNPEDIIAIVLLRPFPHRVQDTDSASAGDAPSIQSTEFNAGDATSVSVDAELALLWQDLELGQTGGVESGGQLDSYSDNPIVNPYHQSTAEIDTFSRNRITNAKTFLPLSGVAWTNASGVNGLKAGDIYLVCRLDGATAADAEALIARAAEARVARPLTQVILDEFDVTAGNELDDEFFYTFGNDDYEVTRDALLADGWQVLYDDTFTFITSSDWPVVAYASYGENHDNGGAGEDPPGSGTYIEGFNFPPGAIFNTLESYNARAFNGLGTLFTQEQIADFVNVGGTFAVGNVWEPFANFVPDNEFLMTRMLVDGWTFAEAAYASMPVLSWQEIAVGDPLGTIAILGDLDGDRDVNRLDSNAFLDCPFDPGQVIPAGCETADLDFDGDLDASDAWLMMQLLDD